MLVAHIRILARRRWQEAEAQYTSHNPLGACMVIFLWLMLLVCALSGWLQGLDMFWGEQWLQDLHARTASVVWLSIVVHLSAVCLMQALSGVKLIRTML